jgi:limonene-1,2-epoxide hydrolase
MTEQTDALSETGTATNALVVERFLKALQHEDFDTADALLADDLVYQNVGFPIVRGGRRVAKMFRGMKGRMGFEVKFHRNVEDGTSVLNERTDVLILGPLRLQFWVCGVFEVHDGRITLWRDYFDTLDVFVKAPVRGLIGVLIPALRPKL